MNRNRLFLLSIILLFLIFVNSIYASDSLEPALNFRFITLQGDTIKSADIEGKIIVFDFWNTLCIPCVEAMPELEKVYEKYKNHPEVAIFIINSGWEPIEKAKEFSEKKRGGFLWWGKKKYDLPFAYDTESKLFKYFKLETNPSTVIIDKNSKIRIKHSEVLEDIFSFMDKAIRELLDEK